AKVPVDATTPGDMIRVVRVCDREASQHPELRLDQIEPRRFSGSPHRLDAQSPQQGEERRMVVDVAQVIHDDEQASTGIAGAEASKGLAHLADPLAAPKHTIEAVGVNIVEAQELLDAVPAMVGRAPAPRLPAAGPGDAAEGADFQWTPFVEAHYGRTRRAVPIEPADAFFFTIKSGVRGGFPGADALGREAFAPERPADPCVGDGRQQAPAAAILGQLRDGPRREG